MTDAAASVPAADLPGGYTIRETISVGRHTILYSALRGAAAEPVAVRVLREKGTGHETAIRATLTALPEHPHLTGVRETGLNRSGRLYAAIDLAPGGSLAGALRRHGRVAPRDAVPAAVMAASALEAAFRHGVVHGDLRPAALLTGPDGDITVSGFGFGLLYRDDRAVAARLVHWSPALLEGGAPAPADDVYGLAATLATLVNGSPHLQGAAGGGPATLIAAALRGRAPDFADDVSTGLRGILTAALSPDPGARPGSLVELGEALRCLDRPDGQQAPFVPVAVFQPSARETTQPAPEPAASAQQPRPRAGRDSYRYGIAAVSAVLALITAAVLMRAGTGHKAAQAAASPAATGQRALTRTAAPVAKLDEADYQPQHLAARPGPGEVVLTWRLPAGAVSDGAGIIIRESPALAGSGTVALSRQGDALPGTYIAAPAAPGQQVCFTVGVLAERNDGAVQLIQAGPVCAMPR